MDMLPNETVLDKPDSMQQIVPPMLIKHFVSMTDVEITGNTDLDLTYHCAFSLPAVALTLGKYIS